MGLYRLPKIIGIRNKPTFGARINRNHPLSQGLVGAWLFNEAAGKFVFDNSDNDTYGTLTSVDWSNNSLLFNNINDIITMKINPILNLTADWTYSIFLNRTGACSLFSQWDSMSGGRQIQIWVDGTNTIYVAIPFIIAIGNGVRIVPTNQWTMVTITKKGTVWTYYLDGTFDKQYTKANAQEVATTGLLIGRDVISNQGSAGFLDSPFIWNRALSAAEIASLYANPYQMFLSTVWDAYYVPAAAPPPTGGKSIFGYDSIFHAGGIIQT